MGNIQNHRLDLAALKYADLTGEDQDKVTLQRDDVLFNRTNSYDLVGKVALVDTDEPLSYASYLLRLRTNDDATPTWLHHLLSSPAMQSRLRAIATKGVSQSNINPTKMRALMVEVPPLPEQRKIAAILSSVDEAIEKTQAVIDQVQVVKKGLMQELLTKGLPGRHKKFKQTEIGEIPEDWEVVEALEVLAEKPKNGKSPRARTTPPGVPTFSIAAVRDGRVDVLGNLKFIDSMEAPELEAYRIRKGDLLIVRGNGNSSLLGKCGVVDEFPADCIYPDILMRASPNERVASEYLLAVWNADVVHDQLIDKAKTTNGTYKINQGDVSSVLIPLPPIAEQREIAKGKAGMDRYSASLSEELDALATMKAALMSVLLTGELRVTPSPA